MSAIYPKETAEVHKRFDVAKAETVITHFACAHKGRILKQGRLYVTQNHLCFYAHIMGKVHKKTINFTDVADVAKANYGVFPNAIKITTLKNKEVVFASFLLREQAYDAIKNEWLNLKDRTGVYRSEDEDEGADKKSSRQSVEKSPRRSSVDKSSRNSIEKSPQDSADRSYGSESEKEKKAKKKKRWSLSKHEKKPSSDNTDNSLHSDTETGSDISNSGKSKRRNSNSSNSSTDRNSGKHSAPSTPTTPHTPSPSTHNHPTPAAPTPAPTPAPTTHTHAHPHTQSPPSVAHRAQALIDSGAIVTTQEPATPASQSRAQQNILHSSTNSDPPTQNPAPPEPSLWQRLFHCCH